MHRMHHRNVQKEAVTGEKVIRKLRGFLGLHLRSNSGELPAEVRVNPPNYGNLFSTIEDAAPFLTSSRSLGTVSTTSSALWPCLEMLFSCG